MGLFERTHLSDGTLSCRRSADALRLVPYTVRLQYKCHAEPPGRCPFKHPAS